MGRFIIPPFQEAGANMVPPTVQMGAPGEQGLGVHFAPVSPHSVTSAA